MAGGWFYPIPPQPVQLPPYDQGAVAGGNLPPTPIGVNAAAYVSIRSSWPQERWPSQNGATIASLFAQVVAPVVSAATPHDYNLGLSLMSLGGFRL